MAQSIVTAEEGREGRRQGGREGGREGRRKEGEGGKAGREEASCLAICKHDGCPSQGMACLTVLAPAWLLPMFVQLPRPRKP